MDPFVGQLFGTASHMLWWQECLRGALVFFFGLALVRIAGRRAFARWSALDIVVAIVAGSNLSRVITGNAPLGGTLAATALLMLLHWVLARASALSASWSRLVEGPCVELGRGGQLDRSAALRENVTDADLAEALRTSRIERLENAELIILEPSGRINVIGACGRSLAPEGTRSPLAP